MTLLAEVGHQISLCELCVKAVIYKMINLLFIHVLFINSLGTLKFVLKSFKDEVSILARFNYVCCLGSFALTTVSCALFHSIGSGVKS